MKAVRLFGLVLGFGLGVCAVHGREAIAPGAGFGWDEVYEIEGGGLRVAVVPAAGRMVFFGREDGENLLTWNEGLAGQRVPEAEGDWLNYGGDWLWAVHQEQWEAMGGRMWPPLRMMDGAWRGEAWRETDGTEVVLLRRDLGEPVFAQVQRRFVLAPEGEGRLRVEQSVTRVYASEIPVVLWQISQIQGAEAVVMGVREDSQFEGGFRHINFGMPDASKLSAVEGAVVLETAGVAETKLGSDAHWIAAKRGEALLVQWAEGGDVGGAFPDGGCSVVTYSNAGLGYSEIETQSVAIALAPGETFRNVVNYQVLAVAADADAGALAAAAQGAIPTREVIDFVPSAAHPEDELVVRIRTYESGGMLHWGVNGPEGSWELPARVYWPEGSVPGKTGVAVDTPIPDPVDGVATVRLGPFNDPAQVVKSVHAVARWGDRWESRDGENYNLTLETHPDAAGLALEVTEGKAVVKVLVESEPAADELRVYVDGEEVRRVEGDRVEMELSMEAWAYGPREIRVRGVRKGRMSSAMRPVWKVPAVRERVVEGLPLGASRSESGWEVFLHAPNAKFVELEWKDEAGVIRGALMDQVQGGYWVFSLETEAETLQYRYVINGAERFADPWSRDVLWRTPEGEHSHLPEHAWTLAGALPPPMPAWDRPPMETWVIYELSIPDVSPEGYTGLKGKLDYMAELGVNAMEPMPVTTFPGDESWGYNPVFHMGLERSYGTPQEYAELILAARERGIANVFDIVLNHIDGNSPMHLMHGDHDENPYFIPFDSFNWGFPKLDQESAYFKQYVKDTLEHWVKHWGVDGYRYDATQWIKWSGYKDWGASWMSYVVNNADPGVVQIAENLPSEPNMVMGTELDSEWDGHYRWRMRRVFVEGNFIGEPEKMREILDPRNHGYQTGWQRMAYIESHDEERFVRELLEAGYGEQEAFRRHVAAAAVTLTVPGIPMLYAGQEWGEMTKKVVGLNPLQWDLREESARAAMVEQFRELIRLRTTHRALHHDRIDVLHLDDATGTMAYVRPGVPESVVVAFNVSDAEAVVTLPARWDEVEELLHADGAVTLEGIRLLPGEARVFRVRNAPGN